MRLETLETAARAAEQQDAQRRDRERHGRENIFEFGTAAPAAARVGDLLDCEPQHNFPLCRRIERMRASNPLSFIWCSCLGCSGANQTHTTMPFPFYAVRRGRKTGIFTAWYTRIEKNCSEHHPGRSHSFYVSVAGCIAPQE